MTYRAEIQFDEAAFEPMRIQGVTHGLVDHPLLELGSLVELARRLLPSGSVRAHNDLARPATAFASAPDSHPIERPVLDTLRDIEQARAWMALHNIQNDPLYRTLVDEVLDAVEPRIRARDPGMCHRAGWIFVTSPGAVTPYHFDHEHNFILQIRGTKSIHVFDPLDRSIVTEDALELFHSKLSRDGLHYDDDVERRARVFEAAPGEGAYMPATAPHWVKNGPAVSVTASFTYYTAETLRRKALHRANFALRGLGLRPRPVGPRTPLDLPKAALYGAQQALRGRLRPVHPSLFTSRYAVG